MMYLGISLLGTAKLPSEFVEIASLLSSGQLPDAVWAVYYDGQVVAVYLNPEDAFARMLLIKAGLELGQTPVFQILAEAELIWESQQAAIAKAAKLATDDLSAAPGTKKFKL